MPRVESNTAEVAAVLAPFPVFAGLPAGAIHALASMAELQPVYRGQTIIEEGEPGDELLVLVRGRAGVHVESISPYVEIGINKLDPGDLIGEMSLLENVPRAATVVALEPGEVARLRAHDLEALFQDHPEWGLAFMRNVASILSARLRAQNRRVLNLMRQRYMQ